MIVKHLYVAPMLLGRCVLQTMDGRYMMFNDRPQRQITEEDLTPVYAYHADGENAIEMLDYAWKCYGLQRG